jgi:hypothetical protein
VRFVAAHSGAQIDPIRMAEAHINLARAGDAYAVASGAEIVCQRGNHAKNAAGFLDAMIPRRTAGTHIHRRQRPLALQTILHRRQR